MQTINAINQDIKGGADAVVAVTGPAINAYNENINNTINQQSSKILKGVLML